MQVILSQASLMRARRSIKSHELRRRLWKSLSVVVVMATIANVSMIGALANPNKAVAATTPTSGTITVQKQFDTNGDGIVDLTGTPSDPILAGWDFTIDTIPSVPVTQTTTDTGFLSFDVANSTWSISETAYPTGFHLASASCVNANANNAPVGTFDPATLSITDITVYSDVTNCTFINTIDTASINGQKFDDLNGNGTWDEPIMSQVGGWSVFLDSNNDGVYNTGDVMTTTNNVHGPNQYNAADDYGWYHFDNLPYGTYHVCEVAQAGWVQTFPGTVNGCHTVSILNPLPGDTCTPAAPQDPYNLVCDFGNQHQSSIKVVKNVDTDGDGTADILGATDWTWNMNGGTTHFATGTTQSVAPGMVTIKEDQKVGYHVTSVSCADANGVVQVAGTEQTSFLAANGVSYTCTYLNTRDAVAPVVAPSVAPSLTVTKTNNASSFVAPGATVTYKVVVTNSSSATISATDVNLTDVLPTGFTYTVGGGTTKTFALGTIAPGTSVTSNYQATIATTQKAGTYTNTATAKGSNTVAVAATSAVEVRIPQVLGVTAPTGGATLKPALSLTKTVDVANTVPGKTLTYTLVVKNTGTATASKVVVKDTLPAGFTFVDGGAISKTWNFATLAKGASQTITAQVKVGTSVISGSYLNHATALANSVDPVSASAVVKVQAPEVKGLATTGTSARDYGMFVLGFLLLSLGVISLQGLRREQPTVQHN